MSWNFKDVLGEILGDNLSQNFCRGISKQWWGYSGDLSALNVSVCRAAARTLLEVSKSSKKLGMLLFKFKYCCDSASPFLARPGSGYWFVWRSRTRGPSHFLKPDRGRAPWACHIYYKRIVISTFLTVCLLNFFPVRHIDSDQYIHHFFKSVPRIIISTQIWFWRAHGRHVSSWNMKNPEIPHSEMTTASPPREKLL